MIIVFDLDDTLYQEMSYVQSGLKAVANEMAEKYNLDSNVIYKEALDILEKSGRGLLYKARSSKTCFNLSTSLS